MTVISRIGAKLAKRLKDYEIEDLEDLALSEITELTQVPGVSQKRAETWIEQSSEIVDRKNSVSYWNLGLSLNQFLAKVILLNHKGQIEQRAM